MRFLAEFAVTLIIRSIERIASTDYAANVAHAIQERLARRGAGAALRSGFSALLRAVVMVKKPALPRMRTIVQIGTHLLNLTGIIVFLLGLRGLNFSDISPASILTAIIAIAGVWLYFRIAENAKASAPRTKFDAVRFLPTRNARRRRGDAGQAPRVR